MCQVLEALRDCLLRAGCGAFAAADALAAVDLLCHIDRHRADRFTFAAADAFLSGDLHLKERKAVEQRIECAERTQIPAEKSADAHRTDDDRDQNAELP